MSYELLAFDLERLLERLQDGTDFPYGDGDERLINDINHTARALRLPEPIEAKISEASVYFGVRRWGTGEKAASEYHAQLIETIIDGEAVYHHRNAMRGPNACLLNTLRDWLNEAKRQRLVQAIEEEIPVFPEPEADLSMLEAEIREILIKESGGRATGWAVSGGTIAIRLNERIKKSVAPATICRAVASMRDKGCPCGSSKAGYWLLPNPAKVAECNRR